MVQYPNQIAWRMRDPLECHPPHGNMFIPPSPSPSRTLTPQRSGVPLKLRFNQEPFRNVYLMGQKQVRLIICLAGPLTIWTWHTKGFKANEYKKILTLR